MDPRLEMTEEEISIGQPRKQAVSEKITSFLFLHIFRGENEGGVDWTTCPHTWASVYRLSQTTFEWLFLLFWTIKKMISYSAQQGQSEKVYMD